MIIDKDTNYVYLSNLLETKCPIAFEQLMWAFRAKNISYEILQNTKDIWLVDFMPIQVERDFYVRYNYLPDYLKLKSQRSTITNTDEVCNAINLVPHRVSIVLDGGNIVKSKNRVIVTNKVFKENPSFAENALIAEIRSQLRVEHVIVIPCEPHDPFGHTDGMVRFIDDETVLINQYPSSKQYSEFTCSFRWSLRNCGLDCIEVPYTSWQNTSLYDATGCYINYLEVGNCIFYPAFAKFEDQLAEMIFQNVFADRELIAIDCRELGKLGGVLNCVTWNIAK